jgi:hypothetical protein
MCHTLLLLRQIKEGLKKDKTNTKQDTGYT